MTDFDQSYFERNYGDYERQNPDAKLDFYLRTLERFAPSREPLDLLEVGCGLGRFLQHLRRHRPHYRLAASDLSEFALTQAQLRCPGLDLRQAGADQLVFEAQSFDVCCSFDVCEHVPNVEVAFATIWQMLRPGGIFLLVVPVYDGLSGPLIRWLDKDPTHLHKQPRRFWLELGQRNFQLLDWVGVVRYLLPWKWYLHWPTRVLRWHSPAVLAVFRK